MEATIRKAVPSDAAVIVAFSKGIAKETESFDLPDDVITKGVETVLNNQTSAAYYVLEKDGEVIAQLMITYEWSDWRAKDVWWVQSVYVHADHRKNGYFRMLYDHVKEEARKAGACGLRLYADVDNTRAHAAYEKLGMTSHYKVYEDLFTNY